jgi:hypothetical protein
VHPPLKHFASRRFWIHYRRLPRTLRDLADKNFQLLKADPRHPSLHLKRIGNFWSVRVGLAHRALGANCEGGIVWFWIGSHADYATLLSNE